MSNKIKALLICALCVIGLAACGNGDTQPTLPSTNPPSSTPTLAPNVTPTQTPSPTPTFPPVTPLGEITEVTGKDFLSVMRLLAQGTKVDTSGASAAELDRCFYAEELGKVETDAFMAGGYTEAEALGYWKLRFLYYRKNGSVYIGEAYALKENAPELMDLFKTMFADGTRLTDASSDFSDEIAGAAGYKDASFVLGKREYLCLKKVKED